MLESPERSGGASSRASVRAPVAISTRSTRAGTWCPACTKTARASRLHASGTSLSSKPLAGRVSGLPRAAIRYPPDSECMNNVRPSGASSACVAAFGRDWHRRPSVDRLRVATRYAGRRRAAHEHGLVARQPLPGVHVAGQRPAIELDCGTGTRGIEQQLLRRREDRQHIFAVGGNRLRGAGPEAHDARPVGVPQDHVIVVARRRDPRR